MASNPYVNKVVFGTATLVDLTGTTATASDIVSGKGAFGADGAWMAGSLAIQHYYTGSDAPSAAIGADGDVYLQTAGV